MPRAKYPKLSIRGNNELAKDISDSHFSFNDAKKLITDVKANFDNYWEDNLKYSEPDKDKWVRSAHKTQLGHLLYKINNLVLAPHDSLIPYFIFGGIKKRGAVDAAQHLQGIKNKRTLLKIDLKGFFEQITEERLIKTLISKCRCTYKGARLIARLCCVPLGKKNSGQTQRALARGFATSSRLATWCCLDICLKMNSLVHEKLKGRDPRVAIYVDDIGISATKTKKSELLVLSQEIQLLFQNYKEPLFLNSTKTKIVRHNDGIEHLGIRMNKHGLSLGKNGSSKKMKLRYSLTHLTGENKKKALKSLQGLSQYERYVESKGHLNSLSDPSVASKIG